MRKLIKLATTGVFIATLVISAPLATAHHALGPVVSEASIQTHVAGDQVTIKTDTGESTWTVSDFEVDPIVSSGGKVTFTINVTKGEFALSSKNIGFFSAGGKLIQPAQLVYVDTGNVHHRLTRLETFHEGETLTITAGFNPFSSNPGNHEPAAKDNFFGYANNGINPDVTWKLNLMEGNHDLEG